MNQLSPGGTARSDTSYFSHLTQTQPIFIHHAGTATAPHTLSIFLALQFPSDICASACSCLLSVPQNPTFPQLPCRVISLGMTGRKWNVINLYLKQLPNLWDMSGMKGVLSPAAGHKCLRKLAMLLQLCCFML